MQQCQTKDHNHECFNEARWHIAGGIVAPHHACHYHKKIWASYESELVARPLCNYWTDPVHADLARHYYHQRYNPDRQLLAFTEAWRLANMPPSISDNPACHDNTALLVTLLDTQDSKEYRISMCAAYELEDWRVRILDRHGNQVTIDSLQAYFYADHYCQCHRKEDARHAGASTDGECEGGRFKVQSIVVPYMPDVILFSETMTQEQLEEHLASGRPDAARP